VATLGLKAGPESRRLADSVDALPYCQRTQSSRAKIRANRALEASEEACDFTGTFCAGCDLPAAEIDADRESVWVLSWLRIRLRRTRASIDHAVIGGDEISFGLVLPESRERRPEGRFVRHGDLDFRLISGTASRHPFKP